MSVRASFCQELEYINIWSCMFQLILFIIAPLKEKKKKIGFFGLLNPSSGWGT
jgi:hypothetical protein